MIDSLKKIRNPFLIFAPFLILYIILVLIFPTEGMSGDEGRYLLYARYLYDGTLPKTDIDFNILGNGPGYSIILIPFVALHLPLICITLFNAIIYYFSVILLFKALKDLVSFRMALLLSLFWACYYNSYENIIFILPEVFTTFLICLLIFNMVKLFNHGKIKKLKFYITYTGIVMGYIALTKPIFGYVMLVMIIGNGLLWLIKQKAGNYRRGITITLIALITTVPYLIHTYNLTGKLFYWSSLGGNNMYWMSTPYENEYGDWNANPKPLNDTNSTRYHYSRFELYKNYGNAEHIPDYNYFISQNHWQDFAELNKYSVLKQDKRFTEISIKNIQEHPLKYVKNCISNVGRILFNYPYSYKLQTPGTLLRLPLNGIVVLLSLFCFLPTIINWKKLFYPVRYLLFFAAIYFGGSILGSAETRMFSVIVPILLVWIGYILIRTIKIKLKFENSTQEVNL